ncbi:MAG: hypothetical protein ACTSSG_02920 [Candidatus Heimdallarchaeaceae archaeon]
MRTQKLKTMLILLTLTGSLFFIKGVENTLAYPNTNTTIPKAVENNNLVLLNSTAPIIDGDLETVVGEWDNATTFHTEFGSSHNYIQVTVRVLANITHLFIAINYTSPIYVPINTTIPVGDTYNNQTHSWFAVVFDNNFDEKTGSEYSPGDTALINYRQEGGQDAFINGTDATSLIIDTDNGGTNDVKAATQAVENDIHNFDVSIEVMKKLSSGDANGNDIELKESDTANFELLIFQNKTAEYNYTTLFSAITNWMTIQLDTLHDYFSYVEDLTTLDVLVSFTSSTNTLIDNLTNIYTFLNTYNFNLTLLISGRLQNGDEYEMTYKRLERFDLIILVGNQNILTESEIDTLRLYVASGGSLYVLADALASKSKISELFTFFGMEMEKKNLYSKNANENETLIFDSGDTTSLPYLENPSPLTNQTIEKVYYTGSAINVTASVGEGYLQFQEADIYATLNKTGEFYIDLDADGVYTNNETDKDLSGYAVVQVAAELQRGGKLIFTASPDMFNASFFHLGSNKYFFLRQIEWLLNLQYQISFENYNVLTPKITKGDDIVVNITVKGDNDTILQDVKVWVVILELKEDFMKQSLEKMSDNMSYNGSISSVNTTTAYVDVSIRMHMRGYGYNETALFQVFVDQPVEIPLKIDPIALIIFLVSIGLAAVGAIAIKKYKVPEQE